MTNSLSTFLSQLFPRMAVPAVPVLTAAPLLSRHHRHTGRVLLDQQCWLFGCDIRRAQGNLLLTHGFTRHRPPAEVEASTQYRLELPNGCLVCLWGFGILYGDPATKAGVFLNRFDFSPQLAPQSDFGPSAWKPEDLPGLRSIRSASEVRLARTLVPAALEWIAEYESWVMEHAGIAYRRACLERWPKETVDPLHTVEKWRKLARVARRVQSASLPPAFQTSPALGSSPQRLKWPR